MGGSSASKRKWFQVTLKTDRFPTGMHGRNLAFGSSVAFALRSPQPVLPGCGSMLRYVPANLLPIEARLSMRPFILRRRGLALRPVPATGSTLPAYIFETILLPIPNPFSPELPSPSGLFVASRDPIFIRDPLPGVNQSGFPSVSEPPLPFRTFRSFRLIALNPAPTGNACLYESPDLPSLPVSLEYC